jgi:hypothetical protein
MYFKLLWILIVRNVVVYFHIGKLWRSMTQVEFDKINRFLSICYHFTVLYVTTAGGLLFLKFCSRIGLTFSTHMADNGSVAWNHNYITVLRHYSSL